uniref:hypothetical protein n=1 Tax=Pseudomonas amygdali TaxID=47877 RepID=UPI001FB80C37
LTGLLALAGILGVGEGHLFHHRKARRLVSGDFAKLGSLFQSFLSVRFFPFSLLALCLGLIRLVSERAGQGIHAKRRYKTVVSIERSYHTTIREQLMKLDA